MKAISEGHRCDEPPSRLENVRLPTPMSKLKTSIQQLRCVGERIIGKKATDVFGEFAFSLLGAGGTGLGGWRNRPIFVLTSGRSGSTFFCDLLDSHPKIRMQSELLIRKRTFPSAFVRGLLRSNDRLGLHWGFKAKLKHFDANRIDASSFIKEISREGWLIVHLVRNDQVRRGLSTWVAGRRGSYHDVSSKKVYIPPEGALSAVREAFNTLAAEESVVKGIGHVRVVLESDLQGSVVQKTAGLIVEELGTAPHAMETAFGNINGTSIFDAIENAEEVRSALKKEGYLA